MNAYKCKSVLLVTAGTVLAVSAGAQTNPALMRVRFQPRLTTPAIATTRIATNAGLNVATVKFTLPKELANYRVYEERDRVTRSVTNLAANSHNEVQAAIPVGSTMVFVEKHPATPASMGSTTSSNRLFSAYLAKSMPAAQPGREPEIASGELSMYADTDPTPWDSVSDQYITHLSVVFTTDKPAPHHPLLPLNVGLSGQHVKSFDPRDVQLEKANEFKEVVVICDKYHPDAQITAHYLTASQDMPLHLEKLSLIGMFLMIISAPMLFAALTGGLLGGLLRLFKGSHWGFKRVAHYLLEALVVGVATVALLLAGLLQGQIAGLSPQPRLVLAFALAVAAGSVGAHFLDQAISAMKGKQPAVSPAD
jgi:hypothetical protein